MTTMRDVARVAGVSAKTVSRVFNDDPHVAAETRDRVRWAMQKLHYVPNMLARSFRARHGHRRVAFFDISAPVMTTRRRLKGYREAVAEAGLESRPDFVCTAGESPDASAADLVRRLDSPGAPTAVFSSNVPCTMALVL